MAGELSFFASQLAVDKAKQQLSRREHPAMGLRVGVMGAGCSGLNYRIEFAEAIRETDYVFEFDGLKIIIDPKSYIYLSGSTLDYEMNLMGHGFKFKNPNVKSSCGCGDSFTV